MPRDALANLVIELGIRGFQPRCVGHDAWESRCPVHRSLDQAFRITRNEFNHVVLGAAASRNAPARILGALGWTNDQLYAETPAWMSGRVRQIELSARRQATVRP